MKISIVGAGISGLATAQAVLARKPDAEIIIFEADRRVGGKVWTEIGPRATCAKVASTVSSTKSQGLWSCAMK